ncbi:MAG TPA: multiheme c-type cytochrome [Candidatus Limnocylindrales bacterium]|nr:multiheme c-type cytochrome [Candidatus Limnocylindrales bacterium]
MERVKAFWASVRPRTRRGAILATAAILGSAAALSVALTVAIAMAWSPYVTWDLDNESNPRAWAARELSFAGSETCQECHQPQGIELAANPHEGVSCESCHGPLGEHAESSPEPGADLALAEPEDESCLRCHTDAAGKPATISTIDPWQHYKPVCLECHDPHTSDAMRPPIVLHPLDDLPPCVVCHGPEGFKARNQRHPDEATEDAVCLECHGKNRGPAKDDQ